jgi:hypothetical protein
MPAAKPRCKRLNSKVAAQKHKSPTKTKNNGAVPTHTEAR